MEQPNLVNKVCEAVMQMVINLGNTYIGFCLLGILKFSGEPITTLLGVWIVCLLVNKVADTLLDKSDKAE